MGAEDCGWAALLRLRFEARGERTCLSGRSHEGPLLVQKPLYPEPTAQRSGAKAAPCHLYIIHPPGGVVGGDRLGLEVRVERGAHALLTTPAAGKFYRCAGETVGTLRQRFEVAGVLEWLPQENIVYPGCRGNLTTCVRLEGEGRFIGWELACLGLPASARAFESGELQQRIELWHEHSLLLVEPLRIEPDCLAPRWGLAGHVSLGTLMIFPAGQVLLAQARARLAELDCAEVSLACTLVDGVLNCRGLAPRADRLREAFVQLWCALRPAVVGRSAVRPRVWAT
jgi:urease accessory protein